VAAQGFERCPLTPITTALVSEKSTIE